MLSKPSHKQRALIAAAGAVVTAWGFGVLAPAVADAVPGQCGGGYGLGNGGSFCDSYPWPDGSFQHTETVCVLGFCGTNTFRACHTPGVNGSPAGRVPTDYDPNTPC